MTIAFTKLIRKLASATTAFALVATTLVGLVPISSAHAAVWPETIQINSEGGAPYSQTIQAYVGESLTLSFSTNMTVGEGDVAWYIIDGPEETSMGYVIDTNADGSITWTPAEPDLGTHAVTFRAYVSSGVEVYSGASQRYIAGTINVNEAQAPADTQAPVVTFGDVNPDNASRSATVTFNTSEAGAVTYGGSCAGVATDLTTAVAGDNTATLSNLSVGDYSGCEISVTDAANNSSNPISFNFDIEGVTTSLEAGASVQVAIDTAHDGDTIMLAAGTYEGFSVVGMSNLTIVGAGAGETIIQPTALVTTGTGHKYTSDVQTSVFVDDSSNIVIEGMTIEDNGQTPGAGGPDAILFWNASSGTFRDSVVRGTYTISGVQTGQGIAVDAGLGETTSLSVQNVDVLGFQKNAYDIVDGNSQAANGGTISVEISGGSITGGGDTSTIAQNGILVWDKSGGSVTATVDGVTISDLNYTPTNTTASGILVYGTATIPTVRDSVFSNVELFISTSGAGAPVDATDGNTFNGASPVTATGAELAAIDAKLYGRMQSASSEPIYLLPSTLIVSADNLGLTEALAAANDGDTVYLTGEHVGDIAISSSLTLTGSENASVTGRITVNAEDVTVRDLTITNPTGTKGVLINGVGSVTVEGNTFTAIGSDGSVNENTHAVWFQDGVSHVSDITIGGNSFDTIGHAAGKSAVAIGIGDSTGASDISNVTISENEISGIRSSRGAYGVLVNHASGEGANLGVTEDLRIEGNIISDLEGAWTHAIGLEGVTPDAVVIGNSISDLRVISGLDNTAVFFEKNTAASSVVVNENSFNITSGFGVAMHPNLIGSYLIDATRNFWNSMDPIASVFATAGSEIDVTPWLGDEDGDTVATETETETNESVTASDGSTVTVSIPAGTVITGDDSWDGTVEGAITVDVADLDDMDASGQTAFAPVAAISLGSDDNSLTLSNAAQIVFSGHADKRVGWTTESDGSSFTEITRECAANDQATVDAQLGEGEDCKINSGSDLVVWTKHFTTFVAYTSSEVAGSSGGGGGGGSSRSGSGGGSSSSDDSAGGVGEVLGAAVYNFTRELTLGMTGEDVNALQNLLVTEGFFRAKIATTNYFGPLTLAAVKEYQASRGISATGYVGPLTLAALNAGTAPGLSVEQKAAIMVQIEALMAQVAAIQLQLGAMTGAE